MEEDSKDKQEDILTLVSKEKFRRRLLVVSRLIAVVLILTIIWIGFIQIKYAKEVNEIRGMYGSLGYCYMCGKEAFRKCDCQYFTQVDFQRGVDVDEVGEETALYNVMKCPEKDLAPLSPWNTSSIKL